MSERMIEIDDSNLEDVEFYKKPWYRFWFRFQDRIVFNFVAPDMETGLLRVLSEMNQFALTDDTLKSEFFCRKIQSNYSVPELYQVFLEFRKVFQQRENIKDLTSIFNPASDFWIWSLMKLIPIRPMIIPELRFELSFEVMEKITVLNFWEKIKKQSIQKNIEKKSNIFEA